MNNTKQATPAPLSRSNRQAAVPSSASLRWNRRASAGSVIALVIAITLTRPGSAAEPAAACAREPDDRLRLACYDRVFGPPPGSPAAASPNAPSADAAASPTDATARASAPAATGAQPADSTPSAPADSGRASSVMSRAWELGQDDKRGTFIVRTYLPNFLLPVHYTSSVNRSPSSPTHPAGAPNDDYQQVEAKIQLSLRAKAAENLLLPGADLWFAYTQRSLWQVWNQDASSPFRNTDYQPEIIYIIPVSLRRDLPLPGWQLRMLQLGVAHQSNGQADPLSRSWNRAYVGAAFERGDVGLQLRANRRLPEPGMDDNPDLTDYIGRAEATITWLPGRSTMSLAWRTNLDSLHRGSLQLDWTHPVSADNPEGLRWYAQLFTGYGETLLDYNHSQTRLGVGLTLFQF